jgi:hypothetical protein
MAHTPGDIYPPPHPFGAVVFSDPQHGIGTGMLLDDGAMLRTTDGGKSWTPTVFSQDEQDALRRTARPAHPDGYWQTGAIWWKMDDPQQHLLRSADQGGSWQVVPLDLTITALATSPEGTLWVSGFTRAGGPDHPTPGRLLMSRDGGAGWMEYRIGQTFTHMVVFFIDDQHGWITQGTRLFSTQDGGASWVQLH